MLDEYKEIYRRCADSHIPGWEKLSKNDLCRAYRASSGNSVIQNAYLSAVMFRYWHLISKYYYMSSNCATEEDCYEWLADSVLCCLNLASWENESSSIYKDPNGPDKVINRCMKCARLTYYQFINRKKRKDNFGLASLEEMADLFGKTVVEPADKEQEIDIVSLAMKHHIVNLFTKKDYFTAVVLDVILTGNVFDVVKDPQQGIVSQFNLRKLVKTISQIDSEYVKYFSRQYELEFETVQQGIEYVKNVPASGLRKKIINTMEMLKHTDFIQDLASR